MTSKVTQDHWQRHPSLDRLYLLYLLIFRQYTAKMTLKVDQGVYRVLAMA